MQKAILNLLYYSKSIILFSLSKDNPHYKLEIELGFICQKIYLRLENFSLFKYYIFYLNWKNRLKQFQ